ncbi:multiubiquitin domain-containing protein [Salmonella enterica]
MTQTNSQHHDHFTVLIGNPDLQFHPVDIADPIVTGRQLLMTAGAHPVDDHLAIAIMPDGSLETLRQDELFDLRGQGAEKVIIFKTDQTFRFIIDDRDSEWGISLISGRSLKIIAGVVPATHDVYQEIRGSDDLLIRDTDMVDLSKAGVEKFFTAVAQTTEGSAPFLPPRDVEYLTSRNISYEDGTEGCHKGIMLKSLQLPAQKFNSSAVDVLVLLPPGYPDCPPDMFYCFPWLKLGQTGCDPRAASVAHAFRGQSWQRWSRHNNAWRPGIDGIHTMVKRIELALAEAA